MWIARSAVRGSWMGVTAGATALGILAVIVSVLMGPPPELSRAADVHLALAEAYFERDALGLAEREYRAVIERPESGAYWYAMYKIGCIERALQRYGEAIETLFRVAEGTGRDPEQHGLHRAATRDFVRAYAEIGRSETAYRSFQRVDREDAFEMLEFLADLYQEQGKHDRALSAYHELMTLAPTHKNVCLWQSGIVHVALSNVAGNGEAVEQVVRLVQLSRSLATAQALPAAELKACHDRAAAISGELARAYHVESVKAESGDPSAHAERLYEVYLDAFPDADDFADTRYFYAELLWSRAESNWSPRLGAERWDRVATVFTSLVELPTLDARRRKEAAHAAVLAWKNAGELERGARQRSAAWLRGDPVTLPGTTLRMIEAFDAYRAFIADPGDPEVVELKFLKANTYRSYNHLDEAIPILQDILDHHPEHDEHEIAEYAATLLLDAYHRLGRHTELRALVDRLRADPSFRSAKPDLRRTLVAIASKLTRPRAVRVVSDPRGTLGRIDLWSRSH